MSADANDVQFAFVDGLVAEEKVVWVFLLSGIKLTGQLVWSDKYVLSMVIAERHSNRLQTCRAHRLSFPRASKQRSTEGSSEGTPGADRTRPVSPLSRLLPKLDGAPTLS
jgi:host factor-I protein